MIVPIVSDIGGLSEWAMVEMQGHVESLDGEDVTEIGTLQLSPTVRGGRSLSAHGWSQARMTRLLQDKDIVQLQIGYHLLEGKKVPLKKPFVMLEKHVTEGEDGAVQYHVSDRRLSVCCDSLSHPVPVATNCHKAVGIVRNKILFKNRPTALISKPRR